MIAQQAPLAQQPAASQWCRAPAGTLPPLPTLSAGAGATVRFQAGDTVYQAGVPAHCAWQVVSGTVRLDEPADLRARFVQITLAGELLGAEVWCQLPHLHSAQALTDCILRPLPTPAGAELPLWLAHALCQQARRTSEMVGLRTGSAPERVRRLLLLLTPEASADTLQGASDHALPRIKDMAAIADVAPETVSRILSSLRRSDVLHARRTRSARFDPSQLAGCALPPGMTRSDTGAGPTALPAAARRR